MWLVVRMAVTILDKIKTTSQLPWILTVGTNLIHDYYLIIKQIIVEISDGNDHVKNSFLRFMDTLSFKWTFIFIRKAISLHEYSCSERAYFRKNTYFPTG